jgi:hypothetical protein
MTGETDPGAPSAWSRGDPTEHPGSKGPSHGDRQAMLVRKVVLGDGGKSALVVDALRKFASAREYTIKEKVEGDRFTGDRADGGGVEVTVRGDALLSEWNEVDGSPRRGDVLRCERIFEEVVARIGAL